MYEGINIIRLPIIPRGKCFFILMLKYLTFVISGYFWKILTIIKTDSILIIEVSLITQAFSGV